MLSSLLERFPIKVYIEKCLSTLRIFSSVWFVLAGPEAALSLDFFPIKSVITSTITMIPDSGANVIMASLILQIKFLPS